MKPHEMIDALNELSKKVYPIRERRGFLSHLTLLYEADENVDKLVESLTRKLEDEKWTDSDIKRMKLPAIIALMSVRLEMKEKVALLNLAQRWVTTTGANKNTLALILQSLCVSDINFGDVYAIRTAVYNYMMKPHLNEETTLNILPTGKFELHPRDNTQFEGNSHAQHIYVIRKLQKLVEIKQSMTLTALTQYDFGRCCEAERSHQITRPLSSYLTSGFTMKNGESCFARDFGKVVIPVVDDNENLMSQDHYSPLENYRNSARWALKIEKENQDKQLEKQYPISSESSEEEERENEEEEYELWFSVSSDEASEPDSGVHSSSEICEFSPTTASSFFNEPTPVVSSNSPLKLMRDIPYYLNKVKPMLENLLFYFYFFIRNFP